MVQTLESMRGGGSIKVGTTGTISALMSRELDSKTSTSRAPVSRRPTVCSFTTGDATSPKRTKPRTSTDQASSSSWASEDNKNDLEIVRKAKQYNCKTPQIPILESENISVDGTPIRQKPDKKGPTLVEIVDIKCGSAEKTRANPMKNRLKRIGFSKLSANPI